VNIGHPFNTQIPVQVHQLDGSIDYVNTDILSITSRSNANCLRFTVCDSLSEPFDIRIFTANLMSFFKKSLKYCPKFHAKLEISSDREISIEYLIITGQR
jgi:hypothetical protein